MDDNGDAADGSEDASVSGDDGKDRELCDRDASVSADEINWDERDGGKPVLASADRDDDVTSHVGGGKPVSSSADCDVAEHVSSSGDRDGDEHVSLSAEGASDIDNCDIRAGSMDASGLAIDGGDAEDEPFCSPGENSLSSNTRNL